MTFQNVIDKKIKDKNNMVFQTAIGKHTFDSICVQPRGREIKKIELFLGALNRLDTNVYVKEIQFQDGKTTLYNHTERNILYEYISPHSFHINITAIDSVEKIDGFRLFVVVELEENYWLSSYI